MATIELPRFLSDLDRCERAVPLPLLCGQLRDLSLGDDELRRYVRFGDDGYRRNLVRLGPGYVALVLCWRPGQASPIHDHLGSACGVRVLEGVATETRYRREASGELVEIERHVHPANGVCGSYDADIHTISNGQSEGRNLITLHVYTPPMRQFRAYSLGRPEIRLCEDQEVLAEERRLAASRGVRSPEATAGPAA